MSKEKKPLKITDEPIMDRTIEAYDTFIEELTHEFPELTEPAMISDQMDRSEYHMPEKKKPKPEV